MEIVILAPDVRELQLLKKNKQHNWTQTFQSLCSNLIVLMRQTGGEYVFGDLKGTATTRTKH